MKKHLETIAIVMWVIFVWIFRTLTQTRTRVLSWIGLGLALTILGSVLTALHPILIALFYFAITAIGLLSFFFWFLWDDNELHTDSF